MERDETSSQLAQQPAPQADARPAWHAPQIDRIDVRRTLFGSNTPIDLTQPAGNQLSG